MNWLPYSLDLALIALLVIGIVYASKLMVQLKALRAVRTEMERFVLDFSATVVRAENGVKTLKAAARSSGDDLEQLIEKGGSLRDELGFLIESADKIATRLSSTASNTVKASAAAKESTSGTEKEETLKNVQKKILKESELSALSGSSAAERELLRALKKLG